MATYPPHTRLILDRKVFHHPHRGVRMVSVCLGPSRDLADLEIVICEGRDLDQLSYVTLIDIDDLPGAALRANSCLFEAMDDGYDVGPEHAGAAFCTGRLAQSYLLSDPNLCPADLMPYRRPHPAASLAEEMFA